MQSRTHTCGELRIENVGNKVKLVGWLENLREVGAELGFVVLRDFYGTTQIVIETEEMMKVVKGINKESTISVEGTVRERSSKNPKLATGDIEVVPDKIDVLGRCRYNELPFEINRSREADETARLKYRYLDLRNPEVKKNIILRSNVIAALRKSMIEHDFMEITTPILTVSSPEGARDYLVPARKHPGKFYALPQAPQQFKQLLMTSGIDRYFQIAPCFRDEDARGDRSPGEFYQLDMEMAFASQEDVFEICEDVLPPIFAKYGTYDRASGAPFARIPYREAMEKYGTDKPDLRIDLTVQDATEVLKDCGFGPFASVVSEEAAAASAEKAKETGDDSAVLKAGDATDVRIKAVVISDFKESRKFIDKTISDVEVQAGAKPYWFRLDENCEIVGGIAKFVQEKKDAVIEALGLKSGDLVVLGSGKLGQAQKTAGVVVKTFGAAVPGHMDKEQYAFCWIVDFPMYEIGEESGELEFCHNPFSMPSGGMETLLKAERGEIDSLDIMADQYDLVCNGVELSSGAVRNHDPEIMIKAFEMVRLGEEDVKAKFPAMYNAFCYGAPPHAGIAPGVDRMIMLLSGESTIREIIPFPMNKNAQDIMMGAPGEVTDKQLEELHIKTVVEE
ncbi:aspartate--tRNA ligase [Butyrivibrio sp. AE3004]|uniref:aspartate--tRNA ligase n=1 Tax=Butyrivibrio sp. AE3004 TaxID=1506994 RepID=UPI000494A0D9|nr:aspartate--tRNA ligase [Butyrivibrio sp. AE3004]